MLNTGRVGGGDDHPGSKKVTIPCSSAIVQGIVEGTIEWTEDPDFGYEVAAAIPGVDDIEILQPRRLYARQGRTGEHDAMVARLKRERKEFLNSFPGLDESLGQVARADEGRWGAPEETPQARAVREPQLLTGAFHSLGTFAVDHHGDEEGRQHGTS